MAETAKLFEVPAQNQDFLESIRERLSTYLRDTGKSQSEVAKAIGFSPATMTGFIKNTYLGDMVEVGNRIQDYLARETQRLISPKAPEFALTSFSKHVLSVLQYAHLNRDMGMIHGDAGVGKTVTIEHYAAKHHNVIIITAGIDLCSPKAIIEEILTKLGSKEYGSLSFMSRVAIQLLKGSDKLLVIDEANHLNLRAREMIKKIHDQAGIGVRRGLNRGELIMDDISRIFEQYGHLSEDCLDFLYKCALGEGGLRLAKKLYVLASTMAFGEEQPLSLPFMEKALQMLMASHVKIK